MAGTAECLQSARQCSSKGGGSCIDNVVVTLVVLAKTM